MIGARKLAILLCGAALCGACATSAQRPQSASPPAAGQEQIPVPARTEPLREPVRSAGSFADSMPTPAAIHVLATIPEPIPLSQVVPPPVATQRAPAAAVDTLRAGAAASGAATFDSLRANGARSAHPPASSFDSLRADAPEGATTDSANVPVPSPTEPLGDRSGTLTMPESLSVAAPETASVTRPAASPASPPQGAAANEKPAATPDIPSKPLADGSCWRVQIAAPVEKTEADSREQAARSLLLAPMVIETEGGLYKVRTEGCLSHEAADALRKRAVDSGFEGAFVVNTGAQVPATKPAPKPAAKKKPLVHHAPVKKKPVKR